MIDKWSGVQVPWKNPKLMRFSAETAQFSFYPVYLTIPRVFMLPWFGHSGLDQVIEKICPEKLLKSLSFN